MSAVNITKPQLIEKTGKDIVVTFSEGNVKIEHNDIVREAAYGDMTGLVDDFNADIHLKNAPAPKSAAVGVRMPPPPPTEGPQAVSGDNTVVGNAVVGNAGEGVVGGKRRRKTNKRARKGKRGTRRHY